MYCLEKQNFTVYPLHSLVWCLIILTVKHFILKCSMFASLLVAQYDTYNVTYMYLATSLLRKQELPAKCDKNTFFAFDGNIYTIKNYRFVCNCRYFIENSA